MSENLSTYRPRCMNLCCKSMVVFGENFESDPDYQAGLTEFWCALSAPRYGRAKAR